MICNKIMMRKSIYTNLKKDSYLGNKNFKDTFPEYASLLEEWHAS